MDKDSVYVIEGAQLHALIHELSHPLPINAIRADKA